jgi:CcmD family protein
VKHLLRASIVLASIVLVCSTVLLAQTPQSQFVPQESLPKQELSPGPLLYGAYAFVWGALIVYLFFLWRRIGRVERELADVNRKLAGK